MYDKCSDCKYEDIENLKLENQELKKQLEKKENQQKEFENWLENEINRLDDYCHDYHSVLYSMTLYELQKTKEILSKFKEIVKEVE